MHDVHHAIQELGAVVGLPGLALDGAGTAALTVTGGPSVFLVKVADREVEFVSRIGDVGRDLPAATLRAYLAANGPRGGLARARFALDPADLCMIYGERVEIAALDAGSLAARLRGFVSDAARRADGPVPNVREDGRGAPSRPEVLGTQDRAQFAEALAGALKVAVPVWGERRTIALRIGGGVDLLVRDAGAGAVDLVAAAKAKPAVDDRDALRVLLAANHLGNATGGGRLGLVGDTIVLTERISAAGVDAPSLHARIEAFLGWVALWSGRHADRQLTPPLPIDFGSALIRA